MRCNPFLGSVLAPLSPYPHEFRALWSLDRRMSHCQKDLQQRPKCAAFSRTLVTCSLADQLKSPAARRLQPALLDQLVPHGFGELLRRRDGHDVGALAGGGRPKVQVRLGVQARDLEALLERLERRLELFFRGCAGRFALGHVRSFPAEIEYIGYGSQADA